MMAKAMAEDQWPQLNTLAYSIMWLICFYNMLLIKNGEHDDNDGDNDHDDVMTMNTVLNTGLMCILESYF